MAAPEQRQFDRYRTMLRAGETIDEKDPQAMMLG
jgi:hypothetical protein